MSSNRSLGVRLRILAVLAALVALNAAFVVVLTWGYGVAVPEVAGAAFALVAGELVVPDLLRLPALPFLDGPVETLLGLAALTVAFMTAQLWYGYRTVLEDVWVGTVDREEYPDLHALVGRLATAADVPAPSIAVVEADAPNCFTVGRVTDATIVVTEPMLAALDEDELEPVIAHEIAHIKNRDVTLMTVTSLFISIADRAYRLAGLFRRAVFDRDALSDRERLAADWMLPVLVLSYVFVAPVLMLFPPIARLANGQLSHQREFAADRAAARLTGKPLPLARALVRLDSADVDVAQTDLRDRHGGTQSLCFLPYDVASCSLSGRETVIDDDRWTAVRQHAIAPESWLEEQEPRRASTTATHPPVEARVRALVSLAEEES